MKRLFLSIFILMGATISNASFAQNSPPDLVIDISGSMAPHASAIIAMSEKILAMYSDSKVFLFNDFVQIITPNHKLSRVKPNGGTDLGQALRVVYKESTAPAIILVTDGKPDDENVARKEGLKLKAKGITVCSCYVGEGAIPQILTDISDSFITGQALESSVKQCLQRLKAKGIVDPEREIDIEGLKKMFNY